MKPQYIASARLMVCAHVLNLYDDIILQLKEWAINTGLQTVAIKDQKGSQVLTLCCFLFLSHHQPNFPPRIWQLQIIKPWNHVTLAPGGCVL